MDKKKVEATLARYNHRYPFDLDNDFTWKYMARLDSFLSQKINSYIVKLSWIAKRCESAIEVISKYNQKNPRNRWFSAEGMIFLLKSRIIQIRYERTKIVDRGYCKMISRI